MNNKLKEQIFLWAPVAVLTAVAGLIYWFLIYRNEGKAIGLIASEINIIDAVWLILAIVAAGVVLFCFLKFIPMKYMYDPNVRTIADSFSLKFLAIYFVPNAFYEELIFRGALQPVMGLLPATLVFTLVHFSYYKRPVLMVEVFLQGLILAVLFEVTDSLWVTTLAHAIFNTAQTYLIKSDMIKYEPPQLEK